MESKFSRAKKNGVVIHVDSLNPIGDKGLNYSCSCVKCDEPVQFVFRRIPFNTKFFRHHKTSACTGGPMTALHLSAQKSLSEIKNFLMTGEEIKYSNSSLEYPFGNYRADVHSVQDDLIPIIFEVVVKNDLTENKIQFLKDNKIESIRFDLTEVSPKINDTDLQELLQNNTAIKSDIYRDKIIEMPIVEPAIVEVKEDSGNDGFIIVVIAAIVGAFFWFRGKKKKEIVYTKRRRR